MIVNVFIAPILLHNLIYAFTYHHSPSGLSLPQCSAQHPEPGRDSIIFIISSVSSSDICPVLNSVSLAPATAPQEEELSLGEIVSVFPAPLLFYLLVELLLHLSSAPSSFTLWNRLGIYYTKV